MGKCPLRHSTLHIAYSSTTRRFARVQDSALSDQLRQWSTVCALRPQCRSNPEAPRIRLIACDLTRRRVAIHRRLEIRYVTSPSRTFRSFSPRCLWRQQLIGIPSSPYWQGRSSNGPTYAEQLAKLLGVPLTDLAVAGAHASDATIGALSNPLTGLPLPINLPEQIAGFLAQLGGQPAPHGTKALINIGSNDILGYLENVPPTPAGIQALVGEITSNITHAVDALTNAGVADIVVFTLPDLATTPLLHSFGPQASALAHLIDVQTNAVLQQLAATHGNVHLVDTFQLSDAVAADPLAFGFTNVAPLINPLVAAHFAPNEVAFFDVLHPTYAGHGIQSAFADAVMTMDHTLLLDGTQGVIHTGNGDDFIFAEAINPTNANLTDDFTIFAGNGADLVFAGQGNVTVHGEAGDDLIAAGSGNAVLNGGNGDDVLATNSFGSNALYGGNGDDALIANRGGMNTLVAGSGDDLVVLKENVSLLNPGGTFNFGTQSIDGGSGHDTLRFIISNQNPLALAAFIAEFTKLETAFDLAKVDHHPGNFQVDGLNVHGIERLELQIDSVSADPASPYPITHDVTLSTGHADPVDQELGNLLLTAEHWGWLTV